jgi:hypothetical protein
VEHDQVRSFPIDVMVYGRRDCPNAEAYASLLGHTRAADPRGFARMLSDILLDGLISPESLLPV